MFAQKVEDSEEEEEEEEEAPKKKKAAPKKSSKKSTDEDDEAALAKKAAKKRKGMGHTWSHRTRYSRQAARPVFIPLGSSRFRFYPKMATHDIDYLHYSIICKMHVY